MAEQVGAAAQGAARSRTMMVFGCGGVTRMAADAMRSYPEEGMPVPGKAEPLKSGQPLDNRWQISLGVAPNADARPDFYTDVRKVDMNRVLFLVENLSKLQKLLGNEHPLVSTLAEIGKPGHYDTFIGQFKGQDAGLKTEQIMQRLRELGVADDTLEAVARGESQDVFFSTVKSLLAWAPATDADYIAIENGELPVGVVAGGADAGGARRRAGMTREQLWGINADQAAAQMLLLFHLHSSGQLDEKTVLASLSNPQNKINLLMQQTAILLELGDAVSVVGGGELDAYRATLATQNAVIRCQTSLLADGETVEIATKYTDGPNTAVLRDAFVLGNHGDDQVLLLENLMARFRSPKGVSDIFSVMDLLKEVSGDTHFNDPRTAQSVETIKRYLTEEIGEDSNPAHNRILNGVSFSVPRLLAVLGENFGDRHAAEQAAFSEMVGVKMPTLTSIAVRTKAGGLVDEWKLGQTNVKEAGDSLANLAVTANAPGRAVVRACASYDTVFSIGLVEVNASALRRLEPPFSLEEDKMLADAHAAMSADLSKEEAGEFAYWALDRIVTNLLSESCPVKLHPSFLASIRKAKERFHRD